MFKDSELAYFWPYPNIKHLVGVATQVANAYLAVRPGLSRNDLEMALSNIAPPPPNTATELRDGLIRELNDDLKVVTPPAALFVDLNPPLPVAAAAIPVGPSPLQLAQQQTIAAMRSPASNINGGLLAAAALALEGLFAWTPRGLSDYLPVAAPERAVTGKRNFALWLKGTAFAEPGMGTALNCWESVLFSAFKAGLVTKGALAAAYMRAEAAARAVMETDMVGIHTATNANIQQYAPQAQAGWDAYLRTINALFLRAEFCMPVNVTQGLVPQPGDLIMVDGNFRNHIAISLGRHVTADGPIDEVMSLYEHNGGRMARLPLAAMGPTLSFRPCPF